jgi:putative ABC transport system permease protein
MVATVSVAVGLGTAVISISHSILLRPLPFRAPEALIAVEAVWPGFNDPGPVRASHFSAWGKAKALDGVAAANPAAAMRLAIATDDGHIPVGGIAVTPNLFSVLGVGMSLGRGFESIQSGTGELEVIVGHSAWRRLFGGDPGIIGRTVRVYDSFATDKSYTVVGVLPAGVELRYPDGFDLYFPLRLSEVAPNPHLPLQVFGRLAGGLSTAVCRDELQALAGRTDRENGSEPSTIVVVPLHEHFFGWTRSYLVLVDVAAAIVVMIATVNIAHIVAAMGLRRRKEAEIRVGLGASTLRAGCQVLAEGLMLTAAGGATATAVAVLMTKAGIVLLRSRMPRVEETVVDLRVLGLLLMLVALVAVVFDIGSILRSARRASGSHDGANRISRLSRLLISLQAALLFVLGAAATLATQSLWSLEHLRLGFEPQGVLVCELRSTRPQFMVQGNPLVEITARVRSLPGVLDVAVGQRAPFGYRTKLPASTGRGERAAEVQVEAVGAGYLELLRIPLRAGRLLLPGDSQDVVVVNERFAQDRFAEREVVGRELTLLGRSYRIVGVVGNVVEVLPEPGPPRLASMYAQSVPTVYYPMRSWSPSVELLIRSALTDSSLLARPLRLSVLHSGGGAFAVGSLETLHDRMVAATIDGTSYGWIVIAMSLISLGLCMLGVYGLTAYESTRRTQEMAVRIALGASPMNIWFLVVRRSVGWVLAGLPVGAFLAWVMSRAIGALLFQVGSLNALVLCSGGSVILLAALFGAVGPALECSRIHPAIALRTD